MRQKYFREHRGGLKESLDTTACCPNGLNSIIEYWKHMSHPYPCPFTNFHIQEEIIIDKRLPEWWGRGEFIVTATMKSSQSTVVLGYCNFREDL